MRRVLLVALSGLIVAAVASPAAARSGNEPPDVVSSRFATESTLQAQGFFTPNVFYRIGASQDIVVVYDGGGPADPEEATRLIEGTVWGLERLRFDRLVIQNGNQPPVVVGYGELEASIGPRQPGFDAVSLRDVAALGEAVGAAFAFDEFVDLFKVVVAVIGATALLAALAFGLGCYLASRQRVPEDTSRRFA